jgi:hypothetical protein
VQEYSFATNRFTKFTWDHQSHKKVPDERGVGARNESGDGDTILHPLSNGSLTHYLLRAAVESVSHDVRLYFSLEHGEMVEHFLLSHLGLTRSKVVEKLI